jgi:Ca2+-transporting ATPase
MDTIIGRHWHHLSNDEVLDLMDTNIQQGLDIFEIKHRQDRFGFNVLTPPKGKSMFARFLQQFNNPLMFICWWPAE